MRNMQTLAVANADADVQKSIDRALGHQYHVTPLSSVEETGKPDTNVVDLVIYDLSSGLDVLKTLRRSKPEVPVLVLAPGSAAGRLVSKALALGAVDFVTKPLDEHELPLRVSRSIRQWHRFHSSSARLARGTQIGDVSEKRGSSGVGRLSVQLKELHGSSGRLDASKIAKYLHTTLADVAKAVKVGYTSVHKTPDAASIQTELATVKRILVILTEMLGKREVVLAWLNSPHPDLGSRTPLSVILEGHSDAVVTMLENALAGVAG
jgi:DNA-binding response OmpR family regulator